MKKVSEEIIGTEKEFLDIFKTLCNSRSSWQVWADLITCMAVSIANAIDKSEPRYSEREKEYKTCIERLGGVEKPAKCFAVVVEALERNPDQDFLGKMYMLLNLGNHWKGQFFTPFDVCRLMSEITCENVDKQIEESGYISVCDPACGAGATLIAAASRMKKCKHNFQNHVIFVGQDIDRITGMMCYIQLSLLGCAGYVCIADTISNPMTGHVLFPEEKEGQEFWYTPMFASNVWHYRRIAHQMDILMRRSEKGLQKEELNTGFMIFYSFLKEDYFMSDTDKKIFTSGAEKLRYEQEQCIVNVNDKYKAMAKQQYDMVFSVLIKKCEDEPEFDAQVNQEHKNWGRCMAFCSKKAMDICNPTEKQKELARKGEQPIAAPVTSVVLFQWIDEYYAADDKDDFDKQKKEEEKKKDNEKKQSEKQEKERQKKAEKKDITKTDDNKPKKKASKAKTNEQEGQMSLFDLFG